MAVAEPRAAAVPSAGELDALEAALEAKQSEKATQLLAAMASKLPDAVEDEQPAAAAAARLWNLAVAQAREPDDAGQASKLRSAAIECEARAVAARKGGRSIDGFLKRCAETCDAYLEGEGGTEEASAALQLLERPLDAYGNRTDGLPSYAELLLSRARLAFRLGDGAAAKAAVGECRAKTESAHPQAADKLAQLLFEFGSETVKGGDAAGAAEWLEQSVGVQQQKAEGGDHTATTNDLKKSSYLMLAHCFYETERYDQCELAAAKAKEIEVNAPSEFYLMSTALQQRKPEIAARHLTALITCKVVSVQMLIAGLKRAQAGGLETEAAVEMLLQNPMLAPDDKLKVRVFVLEAATAEDKPLDSVPSICEDIRKHHGEGSVIAEDGRTAITEALMSRAKRAYSQWGEDGEQKPKETLFCVEELKKFDISAASELKLHRLIAYAKLRLNDSAGATEALQAVAEADPTSKQTHMLRIKRALQIKDQDTAQECIQQVVQMEEDAEQLQGYLTTIGNDARDHGQGETYLQCLKDQFSRCPVDEPQQKIALLVDMVKISDKLCDTSTAIAASTFQFISETDMKTVRSDADSKTLAWLHNKTWNLGIKASKAKEYEACSTFFLRCSQFLKIEDVDGYKNTKVLMMLGADALLVHARSAFQHDEDKEKVVPLLERVLSCVQRCRTLMLRKPPAALSMAPPPASPESKSIADVATKVETASVVNPRAQNEDKGLPQLAIIECRARCLMIDVTGKDDDDALKKVLQAAERLESANANTYMALSKTLRDGAIKHPKLACHAIKLALGETLKQQAEQEIPSLRSYDRSAMLIRELLTAIQDTDSEEEMLRTLQKARQHVIKSEGGYPPVEVEWLVCTAWNQGVSYANDGKCCNADPWMSESVGLLDHLPQAFPEKRKRQMQAELSDVLRKREA